MTVNPYLPHNRRYRPRDWRDPRLEVRPSPIHGKGLVAVQPIWKGEKVIEFGGTLFSKEDIASEKANNRTLMQIDEESWLGNRADEPLTEDYFINHSCDPNLWMRDEVTLTARRSILAGEEAAMDYAMHFADPACTMKQPCNCGSSLCRGQIRGTDWMLDDLQKRYLGHFSPLLNRRIADSRKSKS
jgi:uncharacterized protein